MFKMDYQNYTTSTCQKYKSFKTYVQRLRGYKTEQFLKKYIIYALIKIMERVKEGGEKQIK